MKNTNTFFAIVCTAVFSLFITGCGGGGEAGSGDLLPGDSGGSSGSTTSSSGGASSSGGSYSAYIEWDIPTSRENGEDLDLSEIGGYEILVKTDGQMTATVVLTDQTQAEYLVEDIAAGRYEVQVATFDSDGLYSDFSPPAYATIGVD